MVLQGDSRVEESRRGYECCDSQEEEAIVSEHSTKVVNADNGPRGGKYEGKTKECPNGGLSTSLSDGIQGTRNSCLAKPYTLFPRRVQRLTLLRGDVCHEHFLTMEANSWNLLDDKQHNTKGDK